MATKANQPKFSIVIPTLNEEKYLPLLLKDLSNQTFQDFEILIVDGNSEDKTVQKAEFFKSKFKKLRIINTKKRNVSHQRNFGAKKADADWVLFMDADNRLPKYFLQGIKYRTESINCNFFTTWMKADSKDSMSKSAATIVNLLVEIQKTSEKPYLFESFIAIKKQVFLKLGGFKESLPYAEGNDLAKRALKRKIAFKVAKDPRYMYSYRRVRASGKLRHFLKVAQIELARLANIEISKNRAKKLYPMEGGKYFEINKESRSLLKKIYDKIISNGD